MVKYFVRRSACSLFVGGHTAEMLTLLRSMRRERYSPMVFVVAATDRMGAQKAAGLWQQPPDKVPELSRELCVIATSCLV